MLGNKNSTSCLPTRRQNFSLSCQNILKYMGMSPNGESVSISENLARLNIDLVNDNVYTKFGLNRSIRFQDIEQKLNYDVNQGP